MLYATVQFNIHEDGSSNGKVYTFATHLTRDELQVGDLSCRSSSIQRRT